MWKNELIEQFSNSSNFRNFILDKQSVQNVQIFLDLMVEQIKSSETFYFGKAENTCDITIKKELGKQFAPYIKTPYNSVLYEVDTNRTEPPLNGVETVCSTKSAYLLAELDGMQVALCFDHIDDDEFNCWSLNPFYSLTSKEDKELTNLYRLYKYELSEEDEQAEEKEFLAGLSRANALNDIINCQNVVFKDVEPPYKVNRKRIKNGKTPLYSYKILEVVKGKPKSKNAGSVPWNYTSPENVRFHLCRGHFKTFTEDKPLFGKYAGTFWWNPQSRGSKDVGAVEKEYSVKQYKRETA